MKRHQFYVGIPAGCFGVFVNCQTWAINPGEIEPPAPSLPAKQKRDLLKCNFKQMKKDAEELAKLAKSLQEDLDHSNENVLSLDVVSKAEKIEKLAKKIRDSAKGLPDRASGFPETGATEAR